MNVASILSHDYRPLSKHHFRFGTQNSADNHAIRPESDDIKVASPLGASRFYSDDSTVNDGELADSGSERGSSESHISGYPMADESSGTNSKKATSRRRRRSLASRNLDQVELQVLRQKINGRERQRMHDLNSALDGLREVTCLHKCVLLHCCKLT